jgi:calcineurin-like phosphoesterase family protein
MSPIWNPLRTVASGLGLIFLLPATSSSVWASPAPQQNEEWTLIILPDTQYYCRDWPFLYKVQTQWIADNQQRLNIKFVMHEGDITNDNTLSQWVNADAAHDILDAAGIPYAMSTGNHDYGPSGNGSNRQTMMNDPGFFPVNRFASMPTFGGIWQAGHSENNWHTFHAGGRDWLALSLEFGPRDAVIDWANQVISAHPDHSILFSTHAYSSWDGTRLDNANRPDQNGDPHDYGMDWFPGAVNDGQEMWQKMVSKHPNFLMVFSGHIGSFSSRQTAWGDFGNPVYEMLCDYQGMSFGGSAYLRILTFKADGRTVEGRSYSPWLNQYLTGANDLFNLEPEDSHGLGATPSALFTVDGPGNDAAFTASQQSGGWSVFRRNEGDILPAFYTRGFLGAEGVLMATIAENGRDHGGGIQHGVAEVQIGGAWISTHTSSLATSAAGPISAQGNVELNLNVATVFFPFAGGWLGGHLRTTSNSGKGRIYNGSRKIHLSDFEEIADGRWRLTIPGVDSNSDGMLYTVGSTGGDNVTAVSPLPSGSGWKIVVRDSAGEYDQFERASFSFVYVPYTAKGLVGARVEADGAIGQSAGSFTLSHLSPGRYRLNIPTHPPDTGILLLNICGEELGYPDDNVLSYQADGSDFIIESRDLPKLDLQDSAFTFAFINHENGVSILPSISAWSAIAGQQLQFDLSHFSPNQTALIGFALGTNPPHLVGGVPLFLTAGFDRIMSVPVDAQGNAHGSLYLPLNLQGLGLWFQAADSQAQLLSNYFTLSVK